MTGIKVIPSDENPSSLGHGWSQRTKRCCSRSQLRQPLGLLEGSRDALQGRLSLETKRIGLLGENFHLNWKWDLLGWLERCSGSCFSLLSQKHEFIPGVQLSILHTEAGYRFYYKVAQVWLLDKTRITISTKSWALYIFLSQFSAHEAVLCGWLVI